MFLIPTFLAPSPIHGIGVFTREFIPAHTRIWEFTPGVDWRLRPEELAAFPEPYQSAIRNWCYLDDDGSYVLCGDNAKFMNHADAPNCDDPEGLHTITNRAILPGEELTCNYRNFDREASQNGLRFADYAATNAVTSSNNSS